MQVQNFPVLLMQLFLDESFARNAMRKKLLPIVIVKWN